MKTFILCLFVLVGICNVVSAQTDAEIAKGVHFIATQTYTIEENAEILKLYEGLRVADGDGVVVVPRKVAKQVAGFAREVLTKDKAGRLNLYKSLGLPLDKTVK